MSERINVLHLRDSPWFDGPGRTIAESARQIDNDRFGIYIAGFYSPGKEDTPFAAEAAKRGVEVLPVTERSALDPGVVKQVLRLIDELNIHVLHAHEFRSDLVALVCQRFRSVETVTTAHGWITNTRKRTMLAGFDRFLMRFYDHVIAVSGRVQADLLAAGVSRRKVEVLHNGLMLEQFNPDRSCMRFRESIGVGRSTALIANIGRLSPEKGQRDFLQCARRLVDAGHDARFLFIGKGPEEDALRALVEELGLAEHVNFLGFRKDMEDIYNSLDMVVQSSYTEGLPNVILEALWMGVAVVATDVGGTGEVIDDCASGFLISPGDVDTMSDRAGRLLRDASLRERFVESGRQTIRSRFDFRQRVERVMRLYEEITARHAGAVT